MKTVTEDRFITPTIDTGRIVNVNIDSWTVDVRSEFGNKMFFDVQVMSPYFHFMGGEGIYVMPEIGALVWMCKPSDGKFSQPFVLGFQAPFDSDNNSYRCQRQNLNPGDMMIRTRDENFIIVRRGGVVQIGATPTAQRMYIPIRNFIRDFCENYELNTYGGDMIWSVERTDQTITGDAPTRLTFRIKELANDPEHIAVLSIGSHGQEDSTTLSLQVRQSGLAGAELQAELTMTKDGDVSWSVKRDYRIRADQDFVSDAGRDNTVKADRHVMVTAGQEINVEAGTDLSIKAINAHVQASTHVVDCPSIDLGGSGGDQVAHAVPIIQALTALAASVDSLVGGAASTSIASFLPQIPSVTTRAK